MKILLAVLSGLVLCGCCTEKYNLMDIKEPLESTELQQFGGDYYLGFSDVVSAHEKYHIVHAPQTRRNIFAFPLQTLQLDPRGLYELRLRFAGQEKIALYVFGFEYSSGKIRWTRPLAKTMSYLNVNGITDYSKEFAVSPGTDRLQPMFQLHKEGRPFSKSALMIEELSIIRKGDMKFADAELKKINFAADYDFSKYPVGDFTNIHKGNGPKAKKWSDVKAEIVELDGEKVLHIVRNKDNYIYPFIHFAPFNVDPQYYFVRLTFKAKGKGAFFSGLWWRRPDLNFDFENTPECKLTDEWQTFTMYRPCMPPGVKSATLGFTSRGDGEFFIKDIEVCFE